MEETGDKPTALSAHILFSSIWLMDPPGEEDESHPPLASSWQPAKAGPAWWDALLGPGRCLSLLLFHLPQSVPLEWDEGSRVEKLTLLLWFSLPIQLHLHSRHRLLFIQAVEACFSLEDGVVHVGWVIYPNPVMPFDYFLEWCKCNGILEEAPFQVLTFCWGFSSG